MSGFRCERSATMSKPILTNAERKALLVLKEGPVVHGTTDRRVYPKLVKFGFVECFHSGAIRNGLSERITERGIRYLRLDSVARGLL